MNFFSHAVVASWFNPAPPFVFGAMLPDFRTMLRTREVLSDDAGVQAGVRFHHQTDEAFHDHPVFRELVSGGVRALTELDVSRGAARATAHVGVELLIDRVLAEGGSGNRAYLDAIGHAPALLAPDATDARALLASLKTRGISPEHTTPQVIAARVEYTLRGRPRLHLLPGEGARIAAWASETEPLVRTGLPELIAHLRGSLRIADD